MISILIPTYDYNCYKLVHDLYEQLVSCGIEYEVIVMEDGGKDQVIAIANHKINELSHCHYVRNKRNVGRAYNRNCLIREAKGDWCLIIDSDAKVVRDDYIKKYIETINDHPNIDIISGDLVNPEHIPSHKVTLRYRYEKAAEPKRVVLVRSKHPFRSFNTFNVMIRRKVLLEVPFDQDCTEYGYEDTLMGMEFERLGKHIIHIDNPLMHMGFDSNKVYLKKVETSLRTLKKLGDKMIPYTGYGSALVRLHKYHAVWLVKLCYIMSRPWLRLNLLGSNPNMKVFGFYKLGYFLSL